LKKTPAGNATIVEVRSDRFFSSTPARLLVFALCLTALFLIANRGAYRGFFAEDDLDNIANARGAELSYYAQTLVKPVIARDSIFRPVPALYYWVMARAADLRFTPYVSVIQAIHLANVLLMFLVARALGAARIGASAAAAFFAFHAAVFTVFWRPMYVFDLICATFCLLTLLSYIRGPLLLSIVFFWLALKSKELAVFLPVALVAFEWSFEKRRWLRVAPFLGISALFGIWALIYNVGRDSPYSLRFTPAAVWTCVEYYAPKLVLASTWTGLAALAAIFLFAKNRLVRVGLVTFFSLMLVLLVLPGRVAGAYLYAPFIGLGIAISAVARPLWLAVFFALWIPWNYRQLRIDRKIELSAADERRAWFTPVAAFMKQNPEADTFVYQDRPETLADFGVTGALKSLRPVERPPVVVAADSPDANAALAKPHSVVLAWNPDLHVLHVLPREPDRPYLRLDRTTPLWQLGEGWMEANAAFRWMSPHAVARLSRPVDARVLEISIYVPELYTNAVHDGRLVVSLNRAPIGSVALDKADTITLRFATPRTLPDPVQVELDVAPPLKDPGGSPKLYGIPIVAFGFKP